MTDAYKILDGHMHLLTAETACEEACRLPAGSSGVREAATRRRERYEREQTLATALPPEEAVEAAVFHIRPSPRARGAG